MLESLKDMYICHPFMPIENRPDWFAHIKDVRAVFVLPASNIISKYKNGNYIQTWLVRYTDTVAGIDELRIYAKCSQLSNEEVYVTPVTYIWTAGSPATSTYVLVDENFQLTDMLPDVHYELQPDTVVFMQKAPKLYMGTILQTDPIVYKWTVQPETISVQPGHNVDVSRFQNGVLLFGAPDAGLRRYDTDPIHALGQDQKGYGARNLNGMSDSIWLKGTFPVEAEMITPFNLEIGLKE